MVYGCLGKTLAGSSTFQVNGDGGAKLPPQSGAPRRLHQVFSHAVSSFVLFVHHSTKSGKKLLSKALSQSRGMFGGKACPSQDSPALLFLRLAEARWPMKPSHLWLDDLHGFSSLSAVSSCVWKRFAEMSSMGWSPPLSWRTCVVWKPVCRTVCKVSRFQ